MHKLEGFSSKAGYVLAAAGSAVGLGNIWRFPYLAAKYGGGIFLLTYLLLAVTFGYSLLIAENSLGRLTRKGPIGAFRDICRQHPGAGAKALQAGGWINALVPLIITPYYCVIGGWVTKYVFAFCTTSVKTFAQDNLVEASGGSLPFADNYFNTFVTSTWEPIVFFLVFALLLVAVVVLGVQKGIERFNKILMPILVVLIVGICVYCCFLPGAGQGLAYYLKPDFGKFNHMTIIAAMGQLFFSLSIAMGIMVTYGSYMRKEDNLVSNVNQVEIFDTAVAFLAGLMIIPALVAFGGEKAAESAGVGLVFKTMPQVFAHFPCGQFVGLVFFVLVLFAAATSAISLLETNVQTISQELNLGRTFATLLCMAEIILIGLLTILGYSVLSHVRPLGFIPKCQGMDILDSLDFLSNNVMMPIAAIFTTILVVFCLGLDKLCEQGIRGDRKWPREGVFKFCMRFIVAPCLLLVLLNSLGVFG